MSDNNDKMSENNGVMSQNNYERERITMEIIGIMMLLVIILI